MERGHLNLHKADCRPILYQLVFKNFIHEITTTKTKHTKFLFVKIPLFFNVSSGMS